MTESAPPSGGEPPRPSAGPDAAESGARSPWAPPGAGFDEGPSAPPEVAPVGYAPPPVPYPGYQPPPGPQPPSGPYGPTPGHPPAGPYPSGTSTFPGATPPPGGGWASAPPAAGPRPGAVPPPPREAVRPPKRVDPIPGTPFGVVHLDVPPVTSGLAVGSLVTGIASILVSLLVFCFGFTGPNFGGAWAAGAFTVLGALGGTAAIVAGVLARRQIARPAPPPAVRFTGRGLAVAGLSCGAAGLLLSLLGLAVALVVQLT